MVGDGDAVSVTAQILEHMLGAAEGQFAIDDPVLSKQWPEPSGAWSISLQFGLGPRPWQGHAFRRLLRPRPGSGFALIRAMPRIRGQSRAAEYRFDISRIQN
jgi:hypothetical protein